MIVCVVQDEMKSAFKNISIRWSISKKKKKLFKNTNIPNIRNIQNQLYKKKKKKKKQFLVAIFKPDNS